MWENFVFSVNVSLPLFILLFIGLILKKKNVFSDSFIASANTLIFNVALPAKLVLDTAQTDFTQNFDPVFLLLLLGGTTVFFVLFWVIGHAAIREPAKVGAFVHGAFRGNYVYIGYPLIQNILQVSGLPAEAMLASAFILPYYNVLAVIVLTVTNHPGEKINLGNVLKQIIKNPMIIGMLIGLPFSFLSVYTGFTLPGVITKPLSYLGQLVTPLALLVIGASVKWESVMANKKPVFWACFLRLVVQPLVMVPLAIACGLATQAVIVLYVVFAVPAAANVYIVTQKMGGDADLASGIVVLGIIFSILTITVGVFLLRTFGVV
ncbi:MAG: AEC family transporter [Firmicutes bacterium]|nr:AEC family transporter [Bacillota bacterium]